MAAPDKAEETKKSDGETRAVHVCPRFAETIVN